MATRREVQQRALFCFVLNMWGAKDGTGRAGGVGLGQSVFTTAAGKTPTWDSGVFFVFFVEAFPSLSRSVRPANIRRYLPCTSCSWRLLCPRHPVCLSGPDPCTTCSSTVRTNREHLPRKCMLRACSRGMHLRGRCSLTTAFPHLFIVAVCQSGFGVRLGAGRTTTRRRRRGLQAQGSATPAGRATFRF